ncbi:MAG: histidine kinase [Deltaproteobacteria bacterium]|nr:MAG: histidine kinase [Deltaproteobacteria bacterium]
MTRNGRNMEQVYRCVTVQVEKFQTVILDFKGVSAVEQAFADEIFRVYSQKKPKIVLLPINMEDGVLKMV